MSPGVFYKDAVLREEAPTNYAVGNLPGPRGVCPYVWNARSTHPRLSKGIGTKHHPTQRNDMAQKGKIRSTDPHWETPNEK